MKSLQQITAKNLANMIVEEEINKEDIKNMGIPVHLQEMIIQYIPIVFEDKIHNKLTTHEMKGKKFSFQSYFNTGSDMIHFNYNPEDRIFETIDYENKIVITLPFKSYKHIKNGKEILGKYYEIPYEQYFNSYNFGKRKKKKSKKKLSSDIKKRCKKKGIRLTYTRNGKRVYKSEKVLRKQLANRS
jgi:hypothetical protein